MNTVIKYSNNIAFGTRIGPPKNLTSNVRNAIINGNIPEYFVPTPEHLVKLMLKEVGGITPKDRILEPSAGCGHIIDTILKEKGVIKNNIDAVEPITALRQKLSKKGVNIVSNDIMQYNPRQIYDKIIMNPPYYQGLDILHTLHCYKLLKPGGKLAVILPESAFKPQGLAGSEKWKKDWLGDNRSKEINEYLQDLLNQPRVKSKSIALGKAFEKSDVPDDVCTRLLIIEKPKDIMSLSKKFNFINPPIIK